MILINDELTAKAYSKLVEIIDSFDWSKPVSEWIGGSYFKQARDNFMEYVKSYEGDIMIGFPSMLRAVVDMKQDILLDEFKRDRITIEAAKTICILLDSELVNLMQVYKFQN